MDRRTYIKTSLATGTALLLPPGVLALAGCSGSRQLPDVAGFDGRTMGTGYSVRMPGPIPAGLEKQVKLTLNDVDARMSTYRNDSELTRFNLSTHTDWQPMSSSTVQVIGGAQRTSTLSLGAFDITVGPLVELWGFGAGDRLPGRAGARDIQDLLNHVGYAHLDIDESAGRVRKIRPDTRIDLSGIAKGHAVDRLASLLDDAGVHDYLIEVGGELRTRGYKPGGSAWRVAIERPDASRRSVFRVIEPGTGAIATSGDYRNFFDHGGQRFSHSIDPRTGYPVTHELASVSVVADTAQRADALSTALMILGPDAGRQLADEHGLAAHFIAKSDAGLEESWTQAFEPLLT